jgi:hypothetical protein
MHPNQVSKICSVVILLDDSVFLDGKCCTCDFWSQLHQKAPSCFHPLYFPLTFSGLTLDMVSNVFRSFLVETLHELATRGVLHTLHAGLLSAPCLIS